MKKQTLVLSILMLISISFSFGQTGHSGYRIADRIHLEGDGGWDYLVVDDAASRLYVSHSTIA